jgi:hypothetical protein
MGRIRRFNESSKETTMNYYPINNIDLLRNEYDLDSLKGNKNVYYINHDGELVKVNSLRVLLKSKKEMSKYFRFILFLSDDTKKNETILKLVKNAMEQAKLLEKEAKLIGDRTIGYIDKYENNNINDDKEF